MVPSGVHQLEIFYGDKVAKLANLISLIFGIIFIFLIYEETRRSKSLR